MSTISVRIIPENLLSDSNFFTQNAFLPHVVIYTTLGKGTHVVPVNKNNVGILHLPNTSKITTYKAIEIIDFLQSRYGEYSTIILSDDQGLRLSTSIAIGVQHLLKNVSMPQADFGVRDAESASVLIAAINHV